MTKETKKNILSWVITIGAAVLAAIILNSFIILNVSIPSSSMEPTISKGDRLIGFRLAYLTSDPQQGDIVIFKYPDDEKQKFIKRIIGTPGDTVEGIDGVVYVNGEALNPDYTDIVIQEDFGPFEVPEDSYFMMGDNRNDSLASRYWKNTFVKRDKILGKAEFTFFPKIEWLG